MSAEVPLKIALGQKFGIAFGTLQISDSIVALQMQFELRILTKSFGTSRTVELAWLEVKSHVRFEDSGL